MAKKKEKTRSEKHSPDDLDIVTSERDETIDDQAVCNKAPEWAEHQRLWDEDLPCDDGRSGYLGEKENQGGNKIAKEADMNAPRITRQEALSRRDDPDTVLIDVRKNQKEADRKIAGAVLEDYERVAQWANNYPKEKTIILYCA